VKTRISETFKRLRSEGKKAFIPYIMSGDPSLKETEEIVLLFEECGADIVELGVPFSDPLADGPTIQRASERALQKGTTLRSVISLVYDLREITQIPLVLMTYFNPIFRYGSENFIRDAKKAGVDGVIIPDLPPDEAGDFIRISKKHGLDTIFLLAPTSTENRIKKVIKSSCGFIYYVAITGITGSNLLLDGTMEILLAHIRKYTANPIAVGFGVSSPDDAANIAKLSDGVIVGSAIIKRLQENPDTLRDYLSHLRQAIV
jgi:tryptophan synthase alpha chain